MEQKNIQTEQNGNSAAIDKRFKQAKLVRVMTVAPIMAMLLLTVVFFAERSIFGGAFHYFLALFFLTIMPLLAYPLQRFIPKYKNEGRKGQRNFAIVMAVSGYVGGIVSSLLLGASKRLLIVYITYLVSGVGVALINKLTPLRASGHACGIVGAIIQLVYFVGAYGLLALPIYALTFVCTLRMGRHTTREFIVGSFIPVPALLLAVFLCTR